MTEKKNKNTCIFLSGELICYTANNCTKCSSDFHLKGCISPIHLINDFCPAQDALLRKDWFLWTWFLTTRALLHYPSFTGIHYQRTAHQFKLQNTKRFVWTLEEILWRSGLGSNTLKEKSFLKRVTFWMPCIPMKSSLPRAAHLTGHPLTPLWAPACPTD